MESGSESPIRRRIPGSVDVLADAFDSVSPTMRAYLDLESGEVLYVTEDTRSELNLLYDDVPDDLADDTTARAAALTAALDAKTVPDWMRETLQEAIAIEEDEGGTRYLALPAQDSRVGYADMEAFIETIPGSRVQDQLWNAIRGRGAFRRFRAALDNHQTELTRWYAFKAERVRERVVEWLADEGIELVAPDT